MSDISAKDKRKLVGVDEWLLRRGRSSPEWKFMNPDGSATSRVFKLRAIDDGELSVDVESLTTPAVLIKDASAFMLFRIANLKVLELKLQTFHAPMPDDTNDAHAVIVGMRIEDDILPRMLAQSS